MTINLWLPFWIGVGVYLVALPMVMLLPDTRRHHTSSAGPHSLDVPFAPGEGQSLLNSDELADDDVLNDHEPSASSKRPGFTTTLDKGLRQAEIELQDYLKLFRSSRNVALCLLIFLVTSLSDNNLNVLLQYVSKRYGWTISQAAYLFSLKAAVNVLLYTVIVPVSLAYLVSRWSFTSAHANFWAQKASIVLLCLGSLAIGLSFNIGLLIASKLRATPISDRDLLTKSSQVSSSTHSAGESASSTYLFSPMPPLRFWTVNTPAESTASWAFPRRSVP